jgi:hypothetical protein
MRRCAVRSRPRFLSVVLAITRYTDPGYLVQLAANGWGEMKTFDTGRRPIGV